MLIASLEAALECLRRFTGIMENAQRTTPRAHAKAFSERGGHLRHSGKMILEPLASQAVIRIISMSVQRHCLALLLNRGCTFLLQIIVLNIIVVNNHLRKWKNGRIE